MDDKQFKLSIASLNCRGLAMPDKRRDVLHYLRNKSYSIYCLQDVHFSKELESIVRAEWGFDCYFSSFTTNSRGVAILFNNNFTFKVHGCEMDELGNRLALDVEIEDYRITLVNIYGPNNDSPAFYDDLNDVVNEFENPHTIVCGDWNLILDEELDCRNYVKVNNPNARKRVIEVCNELDLIDVWRIQNPNCRRYTWRQHDTLKQSRLDFFLISSELHAKFVSCDIKPGYRSDHSLVDIYFDFKQVERGKGFWKFNDSLLKDKTYVNLVKETIRSVIDQYNLIPGQNHAFLHPNDLKFTINDQLLFEMILMEIRAKTISYASYKKRQEGKVELGLEKEIGVLTGLIAQGDNSASDLLKIKEAELINIRKNKMEGVLVRSRTRWMEEGEKPSKYFLNMEKRNMGNKTIGNIVKESDNTSLKSSKKILEETRNYYKNLYSKREIEEDVDVQAIFQKSGAPILSYEQRESVEGPITYKELYAVLNTSKNGKSPGLDGFTYEFYKFFFTDLGWFLLRSLNYSYECGQLSITQRTGVITLLPKGDKPREFLKNWRPISLLNVSYKLASACIAERIKSVLPSIIQEQQKGFMSGRYIGENIRLMYDLIQTVEHDNIPGLLLSIDFEKAFDSVSHLFLNKVMCNFNFGPSMQKWIKLFYCHAKASVLVNGFISEAFDVGRGCRQGDGLSPYLFLLCAEVLSMMVKNNHEIKGIKVNNSEYCLSQYADDTVIFLDGSPDSMYATFKVLESFANISGLKVNIDKTNSVWIGANKGRNDKICADLRVNWVGINDTFKILGVIFCTELDNMINLNYQKVLLSIKNLINHWSKRNLTVLGRVTVVKSLLLSKLTYLILTLPDPPTEVVNDLNRTLYKFVWKGLDRVSRNQMIQDYNKGGVRMVDVQTYIYALKVTWIRRIMGAVDAQWCKFFGNIATIPELYYVEGGSKSLYNSLPPNKYNKFWSDVLIAWSKFCASHVPQNEYDVMTNTLWFNDRIKIGGECIFYNHWAKKGIRFVSDIMDNSGKFLSLNMFKERYNVRTNFIEYGGVVNAVKKSI